MAYGLTFEQVRQIERPIVQPTNWGSIASLATSSCYEMFRIDIHSGAVQPLHFFDHKIQGFVESGSVAMRILNEHGMEQAGIIQPGQTFSLARYSIHSMGSTDGACVYLFGPQGAEPLRPYLAESESSAIRAFAVLPFDALSIVGQSTSDVRIKYWGRIETILNEDVAAKRIFIQKGGQSSLEYHVEKTESYYIHSGLLRLGLRIGRAENHSVIMKPGDSYHVRPGVMHMRMALEDTVILECSTRDSDSDSYLVEDGQVYRHIDFDSESITTNK